MIIEFTYEGVDLQYHTDTGLFFRRKLNWVQVGKPIAGTGRCTITINKRCISLSRLAWYAMYRYWPINVDHINGIRHDNRLENLREVTPSENQHNRRLSGANTSGISGVHYYAARKTWKAGITINSKFIHLGSFKTKEEAVKARKDAELKYGFHQNHGSENNYK